MRVFLCGFEGLSIAVPMNCVSSLMLFTGELNEDLFQYEGENTYIYLPALFNVKPNDELYGIIIKNEENNADKIILITGEIECEIEIPDKAVKPLPKIFGLFRFSHFFNSILFGSVSNVSRPVLMLNPRLSNSLLGSKL